MPLSDDTQPGAGLRAIPTVYDGHRFRSRLEARWAVFFNTLGVRYEYEREGFDLGEGGLYLPDFWLPTKQLWIEVKGQTATGPERVKAAALAWKSGKPVYIFDRPDFACPTMNSDHVFTGAWGTEFPVSSPVGDGTFGAVWGECFWCVAQERPATYLGISPSQDWSEHTRDHGLPDRPLAGSECLAAAYQAARMARFEHGERG